MKKRFLKNAIIGIIFGSIFAFLPLLVLLTLCIPQNEGILPNIVGTIGMFFIGHMQCAPTFNVLYANN